MKILPFVLIAFGGGEGGGQKNPLLVLRLMPVGRRPPKYLAPKISSDSSRQWLLPPKNFAAKKCLGDGHQRLRKESGG